MRTDYVSFNDVQQGTVPADPLLSMPALPVTSLKEEVTESALHSQVHQLLPAPTTGARCGTSTRT